MAQKYGKTELDVLFGLFLVGTCRFFMVYSLCTVYPDVEKSMPVA